MTRKILFILLLAALGIASYVLYSRNKTEKIVALQNPNILLITIDTIRPDHLSCYGGKNSTPNLDEIAKNGILFENAFSQVPLTFPSHTSILSGFFPTKHGIHNNGLETFANPESLITHELKKHEYQTGAVVSSFVLERKFGLNSGFDVYDDRMERQPGISSNFEVERPGNEVTASGIQILQNFNEKPWFLWLHYYDPHTPYAPPEPYEGYPGEVQFVDRQIGEILNWLRANNKDQNLIITVLGDHGESLGEHKEATHGFFTYNSTLKIPFLLSFPNAPKNKRVELAAASVDVVPTLLALSGISDSTARDGENLLPLLQSKKRSKDIYFESRYPELLGWNGLQGLIRNDWKLISTTRSELYDWRSDPHEKLNKYSQEQGTSTKLKEELSKSFTNTNTSATKGPDAETIEKLKSLGYIGAANASAQKGNADPKDKIEIWQKYESISFLPSDKKEEGLKILEELTAAEPENNFFRIALASKYREEKKLISAVEQLQKAIQVNPADENAYQSLAVTYKELGNYQEAMKAQQASVAINPNRSDAQGVLGMLLVDTGQFQEAEKQFVKVLQLDPNNAVAWNNYGNALRELGRLEEAKKAYTESIRLSPKYAYPLNGLATVLIREKKPREAIPYLEKAIDLDKTFIEVYLNLGIAYHTLGEIEKARTLYSAFLKIAPHWMKRDRENAQTLLNQISGRKPS
jgi:tetratricopeptide (TPR) repeat protein